MRSTKTVGTFFVWVCSVDLTTSTQINESFSLHRQVLFTCDVIKGSILLRITLYCKIPNGNIAYLLLNSNVIFLLYAMLNFGISVNQSNEVYLAPMCRNTNQKQQAY